MDRLRLSPTAQSSCSAHPRERLVYQLKGEPPYPGGKQARKLRLCEALPDAAAWPMQGTSGTHSCCSPLRWPPSWPSCASMVDGQPALWLELARVGAPGAGSCWWPTERGRRAFPRRMGMPWNRGVAGCIADGLRDGAVGPEGPRCRRRSSMASRSDVDAGHGGFTVDGREPCADSCRSLSCTFGYRDKM